jgi:hypothetical protein
VTTDGENLLIRPVRDKRSQKKIDDSLSKFDRKYSAVFKKLAE